MKVFHIITHFELGGAERVAINIAKEKRTNIEYHIFEVVKGNSEFTLFLKKEMENNGIIYHCSPFTNNKIAICLFWTWFIWYYLKLKPQIIHSHTEIPDLALWLFRKFAKLFFWIKPHYLRTIHNTELWNKWKHIGNIVESYYNKHNSNIAISKSTQEFYLKNYGGTLIPIIYNGIEEIAQKTFPFLKQEKINILFAGRLEYQKGINELISIIKSLRNDKHVFFHIVGNGSMKNKLNQNIKGINNIALYPQIYNLSTYLNSFDYLLMPSNYEGLGLMAIEASLAHTPSIINKCPGLRETLPQSWPLAVENNNIDEYIKILKNTISDKQYEALAQEAYLYAKENFSIEKMQQDYVKIYLNL